MNSNNKCLSEWLLSQLAARVILVPLLPPLWYLSLSSLWYLSYPPCGTSPTPLVVPLLPHLVVPLPTPLVVPLPTSLVVPLPIPLVVPLLPALWYLSYPPCGTSPTSPCSLQVSNQQLLEDIHSNNALHQKEMDRLRQDFESRLENVRATLSCDSEC